MDKLKEEPKGKNNLVYCLGEAMSDTFVELEDVNLIEKNKERLICLPFGEKINVISLSHKSGGSAFNVAAALKHLGSHPFLIATLGKDSEGMRLKKEMDKKGLAAEMIVSNGNFETKSAIILRGKDGERTIFVYHGKGVLSKKMIDWQSIRDNSFFYLGPMPATAKELIDYLLGVVEEKKLKLLVNPGSEQVEWGKDENQKIISNCELYVLNREEAEKIMGEIKDEKALLSEFIKFGAKKVIITDGLNGSMACDGKNFYKLGIKKVKTKDMTGAGDAYFAGVVGGLICGKNLADSMVWGAVDSAEVVQAIGAQTKLLAQSELEEKAANSGLETEEF